MEIVQEDNQRLQQNLRKEEQHNQEKIRQLKRKDRVIEDKERQLQKLNQQLANREREIRKLQWQQREHDQEIQDLQQQSFRQIRDKDATVKYQIQQITREKNRIIQARERQLRELNQQLAGREQVSAEFQQNLQQKEKKIQELQKDNKQLQQELQGKDKLLQKKLTLRWKTCKAPPCRMLRGSAAVCGSIAYFGPDGSNQVHSYNSDTKKWFILPECPTYYFTLTVVNGLVTTVGGSQGALRVIEQLTNTLLSLVENGGRLKWKERLPHMKTKRKLAAVTCSGKALVVAGGKGEGGLMFSTLATVEVMDTDTDPQQWSIASILPHPLCAATATVCGDRLYLGGGWDEHGNYTNSIVTCSLNALHHSLTQPTPTRNDSVWHTIANLPVDRFTCVTLNRQLLAVGGYNLRNRITSNTVYSYNVETKSMDFVSQMPTFRQHCLVAVLPGNQLMVVGGQSPCNRDEVEIATLQ